MVASLLATAAVVGCAVGGGMALVARAEPTGPPALAVPTAPAAAEAPNPGQADDPAARSFDRAAHSTTDPRSIWVVVNKTHPIAPPDYEPEISLVRGYQVATAAAGPLTELLDDADRHGLGLKIASAFRSFGYQQGVYAGVVAARGQAEADRVSARPGHSEHQTGLAVDMVTPADPGCDFEACFAGTAAGHWLARRAWRYGFVVRYQPGEEDVTGYAPEPWHLRYVGRALAAELRESGADSLEEFFDIPGGTYTGS